MIHEKGFKIEKPRKTWQRLEIYIKGQKKNLMERFKEAQDCLCTHFPITSQLLQCILICNEINDEMGRKPK